MVDDSRAVMHRNHELKTFITLFLVYDHCVTAELIHQLPGIILNASYDVIALRSAAGTMFSAGLPLSVLAK